MQNHMPYNDWYIDNQFKAADISQLSDGEKYAIDTYTKGISITDQATADFLNQLNQIDKPITVIFYGDHLPSIYPTAASDPDNTLSLHETDYFIWSNQASPSAGTKLDEQSNAYASSNMFMSMAAEHMNAKVSPYLSLLTKLHDVTPALSRLVLGAGGFGNDTSTTYLDVNGNQIAQQDLSEQAKQLLNDYRLVQYDMTAGKGYLNDTDFFAVP
ncbi:Phosphatidylglycerol-membrane-oligosaccharide glycerophosphotransferase [Bifidobacterium hapali]|uniref:Phosphatidylglycerol-membrane-oligosaccharide glycerophosphotransferase n=1 Tax=Bifidobacterium hapali TaxID=1630172 RepID=A0A261FT21_9BIFI|nr:Phosphatidylglycerol-membrane-oligosaccharide glycerophosphotransferase [Bifidobacterium hapali]